MNAPNRWTARLAAAAAMLLAAAGPVQAAEPGSLPSIAVAGFELIEEHPNPAQAANLKRRLAAAEQQLRQGLTERGLYRVADAGATQQVVDRLKTQHEYLYRCPDCPQTIGQAAKTDLVVMGWVQKVSELILNINVEVHDPKANRVVLAKSVDLRGDNDESWNRGLRFMLRDWAERRERNPGYGR